MVVEGARATHAAYGIPPGGRGRHRRGFSDRTGLLRARFDDAPSATVVFVLLLWQSAALFMQALAVYMSRRDFNAAAQAVSACSYGLTFASALWVLTRRRLPRSARNAAVVCLGITTTVQFWMKDPLLFRLSDEFQHARTLNDIVSSHGLSQENPLLEVSPRPYPGLEAVAALFHELGLPVMAASMVVVLVSRLVLVLVLSNAVEQLTGSLLAGGLAVAVYAWNDHFVYWDSQFAYETLAVPLALAAVAFIARARSIDDARLLLVGASVCLVAVAMTHHITSLATAAFLLIWTAVERGRGRRRVLYGAIIAVLVNVAWVMANWDSMFDYFGPIIERLAGNVQGEALRAPFSNPALYATPFWQQAFIYFHVVAVGLIVLALTLVCVRSILQRWRPGRPPNAQVWPRPFLVLIVVLIPVSWGSRLLLGFTEISDRLNSFLFLPLGLLAADAAVRWSRARPLRQVMRVRRLALVMATAVFLGGYLLSNPDFVRLPGGYLVGADYRQMDAETQAAVRWAHDALPAGSRIAADRAASHLLASQTDLWPVLFEGDDSVVSLYMSDFWGSEQSDTVRALHLRYLYVDRRLADSFPQVGVYFFTSETAEPQQLTADELAKFDSVPGIELRYRHGPISIYDLSGLGAQQLRSGWFGTARQMSAALQLAIGVLVGLVLALVGRSRAGPFLRERARLFCAAAGPALTFAAGLSALCVGSVALLWAGIWLGPIFFVSVALVIVLVNLRRAAWLLSAGISRVHWRLIPASAIVALSLAAAFALAILNAWPEDVTRVRQILDDPSAIHVPQQTDQSQSGHTGHFK